jgi:enterochelin esterase-like enzyme
MELSYLPSPVLSVPMAVKVYLPPCYTQQAGRRYPVLYLLHGHNFTNDQWDRIGADETASRLIRDGEIPPFIIIMPYDQSLTNPQDSPFEKVFLQTLMPWVDKTYRTIPDRTYRAIGGLSRGGAWAIHLGLSEWKRFGSIGLHSGFYFSGEGEVTRRWLKEIPVNLLPRIYIDIGSDDHLRQPNEELEDLLVNLQIPHEWYVFPGRHEEDYWKKHIEQYLRWYAAPW